LLRASARLRPTSDATTVQVRDGKVLISDGRFAETKEQIGGCCLSKGSIPVADLCQVLGIRGFAASRRLGLCGEMRGL